ncbi:MAG TPA: penicillin-binding protein 2 [Steroidobacteraceae bacterium]|nr:penicillin-binding protein 2 [Steroidobacteraceae bacterium]
MRRVKVKDLFREQRTFGLRALLAGCVAGLMLLVVAGRLVWLQVLEYEHYAELSQGNRVRIDPLPPDRGIIYDRKGRILAENTPAYQLTITREQVADLDATLDRLVRLKLLETNDLDRVRKLLGSRRLFEAVPVRLRLTDEEISRYAVNRHDLPGVDLATRMARHYPYGPVGVHALGYVGSISEEDLKRLDPAEYFGSAAIGKTGLERAYEGQLHGRGGFREVLVNAEGRTVETLGGAKPELRIERPAAGSDLELSLDIGLQRVAEEALGAQRGAVVALDPWTGEVLVLASTPTFDPNKFARGISTQDYRDLTTNPDQPLYNRALRGTYPPGSTIKPLMALAGLEAGVITPEDSRFCPGYFMLPKSTRRYRDWKKEGHGKVEMHEAIMTSCDVYFYGLAVAMGIDRIHDAMSRLGFGRVTGIDVEGERSGIMPSTEWKKGAFKAREMQVWFPGETVIVGIGQGYWTATPLQLAHATAVLATRGPHFKPQLVKALRDSGTRELRARPPQPLPTVQLKDSASWEVIVDAMVAVTTGARGTAVRASRGATYTIAGKTGTAQVYSIGQQETYDEEEVAERLRDHALFVAFAPAEKPRLVIAVLVENGGHGGSVAAPVARAVFDAYLAEQQP